MGIIVAVFALFGMIGLFLFNESLNDAGEDAMEHRAAESGSSYQEKKAA